MGGLSGAVLAGGRSTRMGRDKAWIDLGGRPMVVVVTERLAQVCGDVVVVAKDPAPFLAAGLDAVGDGSDDDGPLVGIAAALRAAAHDRVAVVATDMPFVSPPLVRWLADLDGEVVVPVLGGRAQVLHAVWSTRAAETIDRMVAQGVRSPTDALERLAVRLVAEHEWRPLDPDGRSFVDLDTPGDVGGTSIRT